MRAAKSLPPLVVLLAASLAAQQITLVSPASPVSPGTTVYLQGTNTSGMPLGANGAPARILSGDGSLVHPVLGGCGSVGDTWLPGAVGQFPFTAPASGPGSSGSFVMRVAMNALTGGEAVGVARVDVGAASPSFPAIAMYPTKVSENGASHWVDPSASEHWEIANTSTAAHTFVSGDVLEILAPGGTVALARLPLAGIGVAANGVTRIALPLAAVRNGPYSVRASWNDPTIGTTRSSHGVLVGRQPQIDLQLPGGREIAPGGAITARLVVDSRSYASPAAPPYLYAVGLCLLPGTTPLGGARVALAIDPILTDSLATGLGGVLQNHIGITSTTTVFCSHYGWNHRLVEGITIRHPNLPIASGLTLRLAAASFDPASGRFLASQPESVTFR